MFRFIRKDMFFSIQTDLLPTRRGGTGLANATKKLSRTLTCITAANATPMLSTSERCIFLSHDKMNVFLM